MQNLSMFKELSQFKAMELFLHLVQYLDFCFDNDNFGGNKMHLESISSSLILFANN